MTLVRRTPEQTPPALGEAAAWREIARGIAEDKRGFGTGYYLCNELSFLALDGGISQDTEGQARARLKRHIVADGVNTGWGSIPRSLSMATGSPDDTWAAARDCRVLAALWLALEAEDESRSSLSVLRPCEDAK